MGQEWNRETTDGALTALPPARHSKGAEPLRQPTNGRDRAKLSKTQDTAADTSPALSDENLKALVQLGETLRAIHARMIREGYALIDGTIKPKP